MKHKKTHTLVPSARRLVTSLRDMGYDFAPAVADLVDNSIAARATQVTIGVEFRGADSYVMIADNGRGMSAERLLEAMRYGSEREYDEDDLGKFGLGLKTSSLSQCRKLTVACRQSRNEPVWAYAWDIDHIAETNRWEVIRVPQRDLRVRVTDELKERKGTVVIWERLDRVVDLAHPEGATARSRLLQMCRDLEEHLSMVFHRFLAGEVKGRPLEIVLNGNQLKPWDPFSRSEAATKKLPAFNVSLDEAHGSSRVTVTPYVLPAQSQFSSPNAFRAARGPASWNAQQGFYVYRANRMIQSGGWSRLRTNDEHLKLARVALDFSPALDDAFKVNVAKMRVTLPSLLKAELEKGLQPALRHAMEAYRKKTAHTITADGSPKGHARHSQAVSNTYQPEDSVGARRMSFATFVDKCAKVATKAEAPILATVFERVARTLD